MNNLASIEEEDEDRWHVQLMNGEVCQMTLELLDDAFQEGLVDEDTYVCQDGDSAWRKLRDVAGLDADDDTIECEPDDDAPPRTHIAAPNLYTFPTADFAPPSQHSQYASPILSKSTAPVATDVGPLDFDTDADSVDFRKRGRPVFLWIAVAAALGSIAFGAVRLSGQGGAFSFGSATASIAAPPLVTAPSPVIAETPAPPAAVAPTPSSAPTTEPANDTRLNDDTKRALLDADKGRAAKHKVRVEQPRAKTRKSNGDQPFHKGGNKFDPLNSSL